MSENTNNAVKTANQTCRGIDIVNHPKHYTTGKIEVIAFIEDQQLNFSRGNVIKYTCRAGKKYPAKEIEDLEKAKWYIEREIKRLKRSKK